MNDVNYVMTNEFYTGILVGSALTDLLSVPFGFSIFQMDAETPDVIEISTYDEWCRKIWGLWNREKEELIPEIIYFHSYTITQNTLGDSITFNAAYSYENNIACIKNIDGMLEVVLNKGEMK